MAEAAPYNDFSSALQRQWQSNAILPLIMTFAGTKTAPRTELRINSPTTEVDKIDF